MSIYLSAVLDRLRYSGVLCWCGKKHESNMPDIPTNGLPNGEKVAQDTVSSYSQRRFYHFSRIQHQHSGTTQLRYLHSRT